ncbi:MAG TPA: 4'-phosphopantetheinyl transferase superfamily protein [Clostridiaceae bacterium]|nr:4'-phosphopantetheinyl transferase superfamily protein [Clostridiaceae bacterium]
MTGIVSLYCLDINDFKRSFDKDKAYLSLQRLKKTLRYRNQDDRLRSLCAGLLIEAYVGEIYYASDGQGKPQAKNGLKFNISHSGNYVILGIAKEEIGVDIEEMIKFDFWSMREQIFSSGEINWVQADLYRFYYLWTRKESLLKACGKGFYLELCNVEVMPRPNKNRQKFNEKNYAFNTFSESNYMISVCIQNKTINKITKRLLSREDVIEKLKHI